MQKKSTVTNRYSDQELEEFRILIEQKIELAQQQYDSMSERIKNISESNGNDGDWMDDSSNLQDLDMLNTMMVRHRKHIQDLENALMRIQNKRYGICVISGQLIDKKRLLAVLTTTKSIEAKNMDIPKGKFEAFERRRKNPISKGPQSFSRIIKKSGGKAAIKPKVENDNFFDDEDDDLGFDLDNIIDDSIEMIE